MIDRNQVHEGMVVHSSDGQKLGRVLTCREGTFIIEKGFYFATDYVVRYDDVTEISGDEVRLSRPQEAIVQGERAFKREGGLGESFTYGAGGIETSPMAPWGRAEEEEEEARRRSARGGEDEGGSTYDLRGSGKIPPSYGDEGGGGLL